MAGYRGNFDFYAGDDDGAGRPRVNLIGADDDYGFPADGYGYHQNDNNHSMASAPMPEQHREFTRDAAKVAPKSDAYDKLKAVASSDHMQASTFFKYLDNAPKAKAALLKKLNQGSKVAIFAPSNKAMAKFDKETALHLRKETTGESSREAFAAQHMALDLHDQIAQARFDAVQQGLDPYEEIHAAPAINASMHLGFNEGQTGKHTNSAHLFNKEGAERASATSDRSFSYMGSTVHVIDQPLVAPDSM